MKKIAFGAVALTFTSLLAITTACQKRTFNSINSDNITFNMIDSNDVSVLIPIESTDKFPLSDVLEVKDFNSIRDTIAPMKTPKYGDDIKIFSLAKDIKSWRIMGFRFDPCAPSQSLAAKSSFPCLVQLRIISQSVTLATQSEIEIYNRPPRNSVDQSLHLVFNLDGSKAKSAVEDLLELKRLGEAGGVSTSGVSLGVHPGLAANVPGLADSMNAFIKKWSGKEAGSRPFLVAMMMGGIPNPWIFLNGRFGKEGDFVIQTLPLVENNPESQSFHAQKLDFVTDKAIKRELAVEPLPGVKVSVPSLQGRSIDSVFPTGIDPAVDKEVMSAAVMEKFRAVENPETNHVLSMDCVSCHAVGSTATYRIFNSPMRRDETDAFTNLESKTRFVTPPGVSGFVHRSLLPHNHDKSASGPWNLRNFGYKEQFPTISLRTANETSEVVAYINTKLLGSQLSGPNKCEAKHEKQVWHCMLSPNGGDAKHCMELCD